MVLTKQPSASMILIQSIIPKLAKSQIYFNIDAIMTAMNAVNCSVTSNSLKTYLCASVRSGSVFSAGRGWFTLLEKRFKPDKKPIKPVLEILKKRFEETEYLLWSTTQLQPFSSQLSADGLLFVYAERDAAPAIVKRLLKSGYTVWENPGKRDAKKIVADGKTVVVRAVRRMKYQPGKKHVAAFEKMLCDFMVENKMLKLVPASEGQRLLLRAAKHSKLQIGTLATYASHHSITEYIHPLLTLIKVN